MEVSAPLTYTNQSLLWKNWSELKTVWWTNQTLVFDFDTRVNVNQFVIEISFKIEIEGQGQSSPKFIGILTVLRRILNLVNLTLIGGELSYGVDKLKMGLPLNLDWEVKISICKTMFITICQ